MNDINASANIAIVIIPTSCKNPSNPKMLITSDIPKIYKN